MASLILKEKIGWQRIIASFFGFNGVLFITFKTNNVTNLHINVIELGIIYLLISAILFAISDILNKIMINIYVSRISKPWNFALFYIFVS